MRRTMISLRGFHAPRSSGAAPPPVAASKEGGAQPAPSAPATPSSQPKGSSQRGRKSRKSAKALTTLAVVCSTTTSNGTSPRRTTALPSLLGGHFAANRRLMAQAKEARVEPMAHAPLPEEEQQQPQPRSVHTAGDDAVPSEKSFLEMLLEADSDADGSAGGDGAAPGGAALVVSNEGTLPPVGPVVSPRLSGAKRPREEEATERLEMMEAWDWQTAAAPPDRCELGAHGPAHGPASAFAVAAAANGPPSLSPSTAAPVSPGAASAAGSVNSGGGAGGLFLAAFAQHQSTRGLAGDVVGGDDALSFLSGNSTNTIDTHDNEWLAARQWGDGQEPLFADECQEGAEVVVAREAEEDQRMCEDLAFTPSQFTAGTERPSDHSSSQGQHRLSQSQRASVGGGVVPSQGAYTRSQPPSQQEQADTPIRGAHEYWQGRPAVAMVTKTMMAPSRVLSLPESPVPCKTAVGPVASTASPQAAALLGASPVAAVNPLISAYCPADDGCSGGNSSSNLPVPTGKKQRTTFVFPTSAPVTSPTTVMAPTPTTGNEETPVETAPAPALSAVAAPKRTLLTLFTNSPQPAPIPVGEAAVALTEVQGPPEQPTATASTSSISTPPPELASKAPTPSRHTPPPLRHQYPSSPMASLSLLALRTPPIPSTVAFAPVTSPSTTSPAASTAAAQVTHPVAIPSTSPNAVFNPFVSAHCPARDGSNSSSNSNSHLLAPAAKKVRTTFVFPTSTSATVVPPKFTDSEEAQEPAPALAPPAPVAPKRTLFTLFAGTPQPATIPTGEAAVALPPVQDLPEQLAAAVTIAGEGPTTPPPELASHATTPRHRQPSPSPPDHPLHELTPVCLPPADCTPPMPSPSAPSWYDLSPIVRAHFATLRGITELYQWQHSLLTRADVRAGGNFVYSMPTSGGKTLVAELSLLRCLLNRRQSAFFVVPFVALAEEKTFALAPFGEACGFAVEGHYSFNGRFPLPPGPTLFVCTIEKANSLLNHLLEEGRGHELGAVVVDELHMLGTPGRGATLELLLSKLLVLSARQTRAREAERQQQLEQEEYGLPGPPMPLFFEAPPPVQIIGMSATIPNLAAIAAWLGAGVYEGTERPVPLREYSVVDGVALCDGTTPERTLTGSDWFSWLCDLAYEEMDSSVLVFCATRAECVDTAQRLMAHAKGMARAAAIAAAAAAASAGGYVSAAALLAAEGPAPRQPAGQKDLLTELFEHGISYHNSDVRPEARREIEELYRSRQIRILCCTSTLAAGVNLPARRVIFKTPFIGMGFLTKSSYTQMCGRAGRAGHDDHGESYLFLSRWTRDKGHAMMAEDIEPCLSQMLEEPGALPRALLECISVRLARSQPEVLAWAAALLAGRTAGPIHTAFAGPLRSSLGELPVLEPAVEGEAVAVEQPQTTVSDTTTAAPPPPPLPPSPPPKPMTPRSYVERVRTHHAPAAVLLALLEHAKSLLVESDLAAVAATDDDGDGVISATPFGSSAVRSCFSVEEALMLRDDLEKVRTNGLILADDLHLCYLFSPLREVGECNWQMYLYRLQSLGDDEKTHLIRNSIAGAVGVDHELVRRRAMGVDVGYKAHEAPRGEREKCRFFITRRFFVALVLSDVLAEVPAEDLMDRYGVSAGRVQKLMESAAIFSSSVTAFCHAMGWYSLESTLAGFVKRLGFGVKPDLLSLMEMRNVSAARARALWRAGYKTPKAIATCEDPDEMVRRVRDSSPADSNVVKSINRSTVVALIREATLVRERQRKEMMKEIDLL